MKLPPLFVRRALAALAALSLAFTFAVGGLSAASPARVKPGLPKFPAAAGADVSSATTDTVAPTTPAEAAPVYEPETINAVVEPSAPAETGPQLTAASAPQNELAAFAASVADGGGGLRGVYVPGVLALRVVQPPGGAYSVDLRPGVATQFSAASAYGVTGLLADNIASGVQFYNLSPGQEVTLVYGDGTQRRYIVGGVARYQALNPTDPYSNFVDLGTGAQISSSTLFTQMYTGGDKVTFQTCLAKDGVMAWGRLFVTAYPAP